MVFVDFKHYSWLKGKSQDGRQSIPLVSMDFVLRLPRVYVYGNPL